MPKRGLWAAGLFLLSFACLGFAAQPDVGWDDAGEFITAGFYQGAAHPPGYPLTLQAIRFCQSLLPMHPGFAANLFTVYCSALAVGGAFLLAWLIFKRAPRDTRPLFPALISALGLLGYRKFVYLSQSAETYPLQMALLIIALGFWVMDVRSPHVKWRLLTGLFFILATFAHATTLLIALPWVIWLLYSNGRWRNTAAMTGLGVLCLSVLVYFPLRAAAWSPLHWGSQTTLQGLIKHLGGSDIGNIFTMADQFAFFRNYLANLTGFSPGWIHLLGWIGLFWFLLKPASSSARQPVIEKGLLLLAVFSSLLLQAVLRMGYAPIKAELMDLLYLPHILVLSLAAGLLIASSPIPSRMPEALTAMLAFPLMAGTLWWGLRNQINTADDFAKILTRDILSTADFEARTVADFQLLGFPIAHETLLERYRADLQMLNRRDVIREEGVEEPGVYKLETIPEHMHLQSILNTEQTLLTSKPPRTTYFMAQEAFRFQPLGFGVVSRGLLLEVFKPDTRPNWESLFNTYRFINLAVSARTHIERAAFGHVFLMRAIEAQGQQDRDTAIRYLDKAESIAGENQEILAMSARVYNLLGERAKAKTAIQKASQANPRLAPVAKDLAFILIAEGDLPGAETALKKAPSMGGALKLALAYDKKGNAAKALEYYSLARDLGGRDWQIYEKIGVKHYQLQQFTEAAANYDLSLKSGHPNPLDAKLNLALALIGAKEDQKALALLKRLRHDYPEDNDVLSNLAWLYTYRLADPAHSWPLWEELLRRVPDHPQRGKIEKQITRDKALAGQN